MTPLRIEVATRVHAVQLAPLVRQVEVEEIRAVDGSTPLGALLYGVENSDPAWTAFFNDEIAAMWGVVPEGQSILRGRTGAAWLLTSRTIERYPIAFWKACRVELRLLLSGYSSLHNHIDCRHVQALRWAKRLGFRLDPPAPYGRDAMPAQHFHLGGARV